jgi:DeoR/GlpR family transcriptional regulator of sugar metabolism
MVGHRKLLTPEREQMILQLLGDKGMTIVELSQGIGVSEATVRRDLDSLDAQGKVVRVHGGAMRAAFPRIEPGFSQKASLHAAEKAAIAARAAMLINDGETIYLDGGSTVLGLVRHLAGKKGLTIVTNSLTAAFELMDSPHRLIMVGGECRPISRALVGPLTAPVIGMLHIDKAFMGTIGLTIEEGSSTTDPNEAFTKEQAMKRAKKVIVLADSSKIGVPAFARNGSIADIDILVTDHQLSKRLRKALEDCGIDVLIADDSK